MPPSDPIPPEAREAMAKALVQDLRDHGDLPDDQTVEAVMPLIDRMCEDVAPFLRVGSSPALELSDEEVEAVLASRRTEGGRR